MATRAYLIEGTDPVQRITVRLGWPRKVRKQKCFVCPVEMVGWGETTLRPVSGCDVFEALQLALILIGTDLKYLDDHSGGALRWVDKQRDHIGFPVYPEYSLRPIMDSSQRDAVDQ